MANWLVAILLLSATMGLAGIVCFRAGRWRSAHRLGGHCDDQTSRHCDSLDVEVDPNEAEADTIVLELPPSSHRAGRIATHDAPTEFLPRVQDIRPPVRRTPIRRPPWMG